MNRLLAIFAYATLCLVALMGGQVSAASVPLTCTVLDNIDPTPNRFQFRVDNPKMLRDLSELGHVSAKPNTVTVPSGAQVTIQASRPFTATNIPIRVSFTFQTTEAMSPGAETRFPRPSEFNVDACSATADW